MLIFTLPSYGEDGVFTSANAYENPKQSQNSYKKFAIEFGAGYINSSFEAKQNFGTLSHKVKSDRAHGLDLFVNFNYKFHQKFGLLVGLDLEFLPISWQDEGVWDAEYMTRSQISTGKTDLSYNSSDFLWNTNLNFGVFSDVYEGTSSSVRIFASVGLGLNYFLGDGRYEGEVKNCSTYSCEIEYNMIPYALSMPVSLGARFGFAKRHGIELVGKFETQDAEFKFKNSRGNNIKTTISRDTSVVLRYVYKIAF